MLLGANLSGANLMNANFKEANVLGAQLEGARIEGTNFHKTAFLTQDQLDDACGYPLPSGRTKSTEGLLADKERHPVRFHDQTRIAFSRGACWDRSFQT